MLKAWKQVKMAIGRPVLTVMRHLPSKNLVGTIYRTPNGIFSMPASDIIIANVLRRNVAWSQEEVEEICATTNADARVLFVGAHVGTLVVPVARYVNEVVAVEANPETYSFLAANLAFNAIANVTLHSFAAGEEDGEIEFILSKENTGGAKRKPITADPRYTYDNPNTVRVAMHRLDDVITGTFDTIVMDIEGSEVFALRGMPRLLAAAQRLFVEFLPHHLRNVAGVDADVFSDLVLPYLPRLMIGSQTFEGDAARMELQRMFLADEGHDLIRFSRAT